MKIQSQNWYAWLNTMPPKPDDFHVVGEVIVSNPGVIARLVKRVPQGINQNELFLDLHLIQQPGQWPQVLSHYQARYDEVKPERTGRYSKVDVFFSGEVIATIDHIDTVG